MPHHRKNYILEDRKVEVTSLEKAVIRQSKLQKKMDTKLQVALLWPDESVKQMSDY